MEVKLPILSNLLIIWKHLNIFKIFISDTVLTPTHCCGIGPISACLQTPFQSGHQFVAKLTCTFNQFVALLEIIQPLKISTGILIQISQDSKMLHCELISHLVHESLITYLASWFTVCKLSLSSSSKTMSRLHLMSNECGKWMFWR